MPSRCSIPPDSRSTRRPTCAALLFGNVKAAKTGPKTLVVCGRGEEARDALERVTAQPRARRRHDDGALDVKDVLRYDAPCLHDRRIRRRCRPARRCRRSPQWTPATSSSPRGSPKIDGRRAAQSVHASSCTRTRRKTQIRHAIESIFNVNVTKVNTVNVRGKSRTSRARACVRSGKQSDFKKAIVTLKAGQKIELGGVNYFEQ